MNKIKRKLALVMAMVLSITAIAPAGSAFAADIPTESDASQELVLYDANERTDLDATEIVIADDLNVEINSDYDVTDVTDGIHFNPEKVNVSYYDAEGSFDISKTGTYDTYYKVEPISKKQPYLICRKVKVYENEMTSEATEDNGNSSEDNSSDDSEDGPSDMVGEKADFENYPLSEGELESISSNEATITIRLDEDGNVDWDEDSIEESDDADTTAESTEDSNVQAKATVFDSVKNVFAGIADFAFPAMTVHAAEKNKGDTMKVSYSGYAKYCGHSMGIKYISESGDYYHHLVYCLDLNKGTTNGTTTSETAGSKIKPQITYCLINGARTLGGTCHNSSFSAGSASADYFITSAAIHVVNGEVGLSYYNNGSTVYKKIEALVAAAKAVDENHFNFSTGTTNSITYSISPANSQWDKIEDGLYRSKDKFVRTKSGSITNVVYTISGAPSGLTTGEIKTDASKIDNEDDLKKYDICVAQTDASSASSNFYLYCNDEAMKKIVDNNSTIKVKAKAYSKESGGRKWTPSVVGQQKITFLETDFITNPASAYVKVTSNFKEGSFELGKTDKYSGVPVPGATYYLYEDKDCDELLCKLKKTDAAGMSLSGKLILTESKYYLKEVLEPDGYQCDSNVYEIGLEWFTLYDSDGKVTQKGKTYNVEEIPETVGVLVDKIDEFSGNTLKKAKFAVFNDKACTVRTKLSDTEGEVPEFGYNEDLDTCASLKFVKKQDTYYVKEVVVPDGYVDPGTVWEVKPNYGEFAHLKIPNKPFRCDVQADKKDKEAGTSQGDATLEGATYGLYATEDIYYPDGSAIVKYTGNDNIQSTKGTDFKSTGVEAKKDALLATVKTDGKGEFNFSNLYYGDYYIKEIQESTGYLLDTTVYDVKFKSEKNEHKDISVSRHVTETVKKQAFSILKISTDGEDSEEVDKVEGAEFTVKLKSDIDAN